MRWCPKPNKREARGPHVLPVHPRALGPPIRVMKVKAATYPIANGSHGDKESNRRRNLNGADRTSLHTDKNYDMNNPCVRTERCMHGMAPLAGRGTRATPAGQAPRQAADGAGRHTLPCCWAHVRRAAEAVRHAASDSWSMQHRQYKAACRLSGATHSRLATKLLSDWGRAVCVWGRFN